MSDSFQCLVSKRMDGAVVPPLGILYDRWFLLCCFGRSLSSSMARRYGRFHGRALLASSSTVEMPERVIALPCFALGIIEPFLLDHCLTHWSTCLSSLKTC